MNMVGRIYDVNVKLLALMLLPLSWRRPLLGGLAYALVGPVGVLVGDLRRFRAECGVGLEHNGQVCRLRKVLNDLFDPENRRIRVLDADGMESDCWRIWERTECRGVVVGRRNEGSVVRLPRRGFVGTSWYDFIVELPMALMETVDKGRLGAVVDRFRLASRRWVLLARED